MSDMLGVIFYEQRSIATEFGFIEVPLSLRKNHRVAAGHPRPPPCGDIAPYKMFH